MKQKEYDVVIVGGGPGGYTAALYAARSGFSVLVLEKLSPGGQMATTEQIDNYPGFEDGIDGYTLATKMKKGADRFGVETAFAQVEEMELTSNPKKTYHLRRGSPRTHCDSGNGRLSPRTGCPRRAGNARTWRRLLCGLRWDDV